MLLGRRRVEVVEVLDRWLAPDHRYFKIEGDDGGIYILRHDVAVQRWKLTMFKCRDSRTAGGRRTRETNYESSVGR